MNLHLVTLSDAKHLHDLADRDGPFAARPTSRRYAIPQTSLRRWVDERLRREPRSDGSVIYSFALSGSTCTNMGRGLEAVMTVVVDASGIVRDAKVRPQPNDKGCDAMCAADSNGRLFLEKFGGCDEALGLTLEQAAFHNWNVEISGCFCTEGNRRHKWRNVFQALHYAVTHDHEKP